MSPLKKALIRVMCTHGIHYEAIPDLGMYGDASRCIHCGADHYNMKYLHAVTHDGKRATDRDKSKPNTGG